VDRTTKWLPIAAQEDGSALVRGVTEGPLAAWIEVPPFASIPVSAVVGDALTDVGEVRLTRGSTLSVRFKNGTVPGGVSVEAKFTQVPGLVRTAGPPAG